MVTEEYKRFGETVRSLRKQRGEPLRVVAAAIEIDSTLLSKIEHGERFPTDAQVVRLAKYFGLPADQLIPQVIAERIVADYGRDVTTLRAIKIAKEHISTYVEDEE